MSNPRKVFVIHGRDEQVRVATFQFLRALGLHPLEWEELVRATGTATPFLGEVVAEAFTDIQAAVVLLTPDDVAHLHPHLQEPDDPSYETALTGQARPNVILEAGMALALYRSRTVIVEFGQLRPFADLGGFNVIRFDGTVQRLQKIANRLKIAGCAVDDSNTDWMDITRWANLDATTRRP